MTKIILTLLAALTLIAPASAAANQWYIQDGKAGRRHELPAGQTSEVVTAGTFILKIKLNRHGEFESECAVTGTEALSDPTRTEAFAQTTSIIFSGCTNGVVVTAALPWMAGELAGSCQPCTITRPEALEISVAGADYGVFEGTVTGKIGDFDDPIKDDIDAVFQLQGGHGGALTNEQGSVTLGGQERFGSRTADTQACGEPNIAAPVEKGEEGG